MENLIRALCALSIFCGAVQSITPEGRAKKGMRFVCAVVILAFAVNAVNNLDLEDYALELALQREREEEFLRSSEEMRNSLERIVIESEYAAYVQDMADRMQIPVRNVDVQAKWSLEGLWVPYSARMEGTLDLAERQRLSALIEAELGIPMHRQEWRTDENEGSG